MATNSNGVPPGPPAAEPMGAAPSPGSGSPPARAVSPWLRPALIAVLLVPIGLILVWSLLEYDGAGRDGGTYALNIAMSLVVLPLLALAGLGAAILAFRRAAHRPLALAASALSAALALPFVSVPLTETLKAMETRYIDNLTSANARYICIPPGRGWPAPTYRPLASTVAAGVASPPGIQSVGHPEAAPERAIQPPDEAEDEGYEDGEGYENEGEGSTALAHEDEIAEWANRQQIARIREIDVSRLDPALPSRPLGEWLHELAGEDGYLYWETNDCGEGGDGREAPTCVDADVKWRPCGTLAILLSVADTEGNEAGEPTLWSIDLSGMGPRVRVKSLHEVPDRLREARALDAELRPHPEHILTRDQAIEAAKRIELHELDEKLGTETFGSWIEKLAGPGRPLFWLATACKDGSREFYLADSCDESWACAEVQFKDDREGVTVSIHLGTVRRGLLGKPSVDYVFHWASGRKKGVSDPQLHELPGQLLSRQR